MEGLRRLGHFKAVTIKRRLLAVDTLRMSGPATAAALRNKLKPQRYAPQNEWWWKDVKLQPEEAAWGGEVGGRAQDLLSAARAGHPLLLEGSRKIV